MEVGFEDGLKDEFHGGLHHAVLNRRDGHS
jgi:hypothetical protein